MGVHDLAVAVADHDNPAVFDAAAETFGQARRKAGEISGITATVAGLEFSPVGEAEDVLNAQVPS
jgi:hypothetical protein